MTIRQIIVKLLYPLIMKAEKKETKNIHHNPGGVQPLVPFHSLESTLNNKQVFPFSQLKGKKVLLVNVASNCGYTPQYTELEALYQKHKEKLVILGFPANDFKEQEPGTDEEIASFCKLNFGVTFPLFQKQSVLDVQESRVYKWLTDPAENGWNSQKPAWNFCKYLVDENGKLVAFFPSAISPLGKEIVSLL
jgi:glutathione peroxidase